MLVTSQVESGPEGAKVLCFRSDVVEKFMLESVHRTDKSRCVVSPNSSDIFADFEECRYTLDLSHTVRCCTHCARLVILILSCHSFHLAIAGELYSHC